MFVEFLPQETNFNPVLRVVRGEDACLSGIIEESEVCADITNSVPGRGFYDQGGQDETYFIIVDTELGESGKYAFEVRFGDGAFAGDCYDATEEQPIELMTGRQLCVGGQPRGQAGSPRQRAAAHPATTTSSS